MSKKVVVALLATLIIASLVFMTSLSSRQQNPKTGNGKIAVIYVEGVISGSDEQGGFLNSTAGGSSIMEQLKQAREDDTIKAVLLRINSPGGSSAASEEIGGEIEKVRKAGKVVVTSMGDVAASGGYWIAAKTDRIMAASSTMTGSIGVIMDMQNMRELYDKIGISPETIKSGPHKDMGSATRALTPDERAILQNMVNDIYQQFVDVVAKGRHMDRKKALSLADGRVFTGRQAKANGLVDELGNFYDAIDLTAKLAHIKGKPEVIEMGNKSPFEKLLGSTSMGSVTKSINQLLYAKFAQESINQGSGLMSR